MRRGGGEEMGERASRMAEFWRALSCQAENLLLRGSLACMEIVEEGVEAEVRTRPGRGGQPTWREGVDRPRHRGGARGRQRRSRPLQRFFCWS